MLLEREREREREREKERGRESYYQSELKMKNYYGMKKRCKRLSQ